MIGLVDYDWLQSSKTKILVPNLEIMKLATYYRREENTFCRLLDLNDNDLSVYEKIYFFSEADEPPQIPQNFLSAKNVIYGGTAFTKGEYIPFTNAIIDYTIANPFIYKEFLKQKYQDGIKAKVISHVLDDSYYRMFAGAEKLPIPPIVSKKRLFLYDRNIFANGWSNIIDEISARKPSQIIPIHPAICKKISDYFTFREKKFCRTAEIILDINIPLEETWYMLKKYKKMFLADLTESSAVYLILGDSFPSSFQYFNDFIYKLNLLYSFWSAGIPIKIKYKAPDIGYQNPLINLEQLIENWACGETKNLKSINDRIHFRINKDKQKIIQEEKDLLIKFYPSAKDLFMQNFNDLKSRGRWNI